MEEKRHLARSSPITWDFYEGGYGPSILAQLPDFAAVSMLRELFTRVADTGATVRLHDQPGMRLEHIKSFDLVRTTVPSRKTLWRKDDLMFVWSATADRWRRYATMLDPFLEGQSGHQYLTEEGHDDALIEVSFGESHT